MNISIHYNSWLYFFHYLWSSLGESKFKAVNLLPLLLILQKAVFYSHDCQFCFTNRRNITILKAHFYIYVLVPPLCKN